MKKKLFSFLTALLVILYCHPSMSQNIYNEKNVDRTAMTIYDGLQTFRALEYTVNLDPMSQKIYRLETLPENGFPALNLLGIDGPDDVFFEDKAPYDNMFTDNSTPFISGEAVQLFNGFQKVMTVFDNKFQWKGIDGFGTIPIQLFINNSDKSDLVSGSYAYYFNQQDNKHFMFGRSIQNNTPLWCAIDMIAHEFSHAVMKHRSNVLNLESPCAEYRSIDEGLADVFGVYIKNKILQSTPQNYNWLIGETAIAPLQDIRAPKTYNSADTYKGQNYVNICDYNYSITGGMGIVPKWFYLLSAGFSGSAVNDLGYQYGNISGIGVEKAIQIIWNSIPDLKAYSTYPSLRTITLNAAAQLYGAGSLEYQAVQKAWCAVGVCDNNLPFFTISPVNAGSNIDPWPGTKVSFSWENNPHVKEVEVQFSKKYDFSDIPQVVKVSNFDLLFKPGGGVIYVGTAMGNFRPEETVYVRAKITQADANFCKGFNPLCQLYQQFSPTNAFTLSDKRAQFWHSVPSDGFIANAWNNPNIQWKLVDGAEEYLFEVCNDKNFITTVAFGNTKYTGNFLESGGIDGSKLELDKYYYLRVRAVRFNPQTVPSNWGKWSKIDSVKLYVPPTSVLQGLNQGPNDPPTVVSSLGFGVDYYKIPGAFQYLVQVSTDEAFSNIVSSKVAPGNVTNTLVTLPNLSDQTDLYVRVLPQKGLQYAGCTNVWRIKTDKNATLLAMAGPDPKIPVPFKTPLGKKFFWVYGTVNPDLVAHFKLCIKEKGSGEVMTCFITPGKALEKEVVDQLLYDDHLGFEASVAAVGPDGAETGLSSPFAYTICPDSPFPKFPTENDQIDPALPVLVTWDASQWVEPGQPYLLTIADNGIPVFGFNNAPTTETSMLLPAGTLGNGKKYTLTIKNSASCPGIDVPKVLFSTVAGGNNNPQPPVKKDLDIKVIGFRNNLDPADPTKLIETSDYQLGLVVKDSDGKVVPFVDSNGDPLTAFWVDSENAICGLFKKDMEVGKYTLEVTILSLPQPLAYNLANQPNFSVVLDGTTVVIDKHVITINPFDPASPSHEWQANHLFPPIVLDHK